MYILWAIAKFIGFGVFTLILLRLGEHIKIEDDE